MPSVHYSPTGQWISCGLPSPGSREQGYMGGEHLRPATIDSVMTTKDVTKVDCKRCRKSSEFREDRRAAAKLPPEKT